MNLKIISAILFSVLMIGTCFGAVSSMGVFKQGTCISLQQSCANCTAINITSIIAPNSTNVIGEMAMTKAGTQYTYSFCNTTDLGTYIVNGIGDPDGSVAIWSYDLDVNLMGEELTQAKTTLYFILLIIGFVFFGLTFYGAVRFPFKNKRNEEGDLISINDLKYLKIAMFVFSYLEFLFIMSIAKNLAGGFLFNGGLYEFLNFIYTILLIGTLPLFPLLIFFTIMIWLNDKKMQDAIQRGLPV